MKNQFERAMDVIKKNLKDDPFSTGDMRAFYVAVKCLLKSAETGKGLYLVRKRHIKTIYDYALNVADVTGTVGVILNEVAVALKKVASWEAGNNGKAIIERQYV